MAKSERPLRAVTDADIPPDMTAEESKKVLTLEQAIESGKYLEILRAQRREIVASLPEEKGPAKAALHRQLSLISKEIQALEATEEQEAEENAEPAEDEAWDAEAI